MGPELLTPMHLLFLAILGLLLFGPKRLPEIGRSLGSGLREFKSSMNGIVGSDSAHEYPAAAAGSCACAQCRRDAGPGRPRRMSHRPPSLL